MPKKCGDVKIPSFTSPYTLNTQRGWHTSKSSETGNLPHANFCKICLFGTHSAVRKVKKLRTVILQPDYVQ